MLRNKGINKEFMKKVVVRMYVYMYLCVLWDVGWGQECQEEKREGVFGKCFWCEDIFVVFGGEKSKVYLRNCLFNGYCYFFSVL